MSESQQGADATPTNPSVAGLRLTLLRAAWLAILLGLVMEVLLLLFAAGLGIFPGLEFAAADLVRQVSWSPFVCVGLALGTAVTQARVPLMGLLGLIAAPIAFVISRGLHQGAVKTLEIAGSGANAPPVLLVALLKGVEYACLGVAIDPTGTARGVEPRSTLRSGSSLGFSSAAPLWALRTGCPPRLQLLRPSSPKA